jgi:hypothetical protein
MSVLNYPAEPREANYPQLWLIHCFKFLENSKILHQKPNKQSNQPTNKDNKCNSLNNTAEQPKDKQIYKDLTQLKHLISTRFPHESGKSIIVHRLSYVYVHI